MNSANQTVSETRQPDTLEWSRISMVAGLTTALIHDLNNPLAGILGYAQYLIRNKNLPEEIREPLKDIYYESVRLNKIIGSFANLSRKDGTPGFFLVEEAVREVIHFHQKQFERRGAKLEICISDDLQLMTTRNLFQQAIYHLLETVLRILPDDALNHIVRVSAQDNPDILTISVLGAMSNNPEPAAVQIVPVELLLDRLGVTLTPMSSVNRLDYMIHFPSPHGGSR